MLNYILPITPQFYATCHAQRKLARRNRMCGSCFSPTNYTCLTCEYFFCIRCLVFLHGEAVTHENFKSDFQYSLVLNFSSGQHYKRIKKDDGVSHSVH